MNEARDSKIDMTEPSSMLDIFGISRFLRAATAHRKLILVIPVLWLVIGNIWFATAREEYLGEVQVIPAAVGAGSSSAMSGAARLLGGGLGGLLSGDSGSDSLFSIYSESWTAPWFAADILKNQELTRRIFRERWMPESQSWKPPGIVGRTLRGIFGARSPANGEPTVQMMLTYLDNRIKVQRGRGQVITLISFQESDRSLTSDLLNFGHRHITEHIRQIYEKRAQGSIANILGELNHVTVSEYRTALLQELAEQEKMRMMSSANDQFAAQSLGLYVTSAPVSPRPIVVVALSLFISCAIYAALVLLWDIKNRRSNPARSF